MTSMTDAPSSLNHAMFKITKEARPHEVAILTLANQGKNTKEIAHVLHYKKPQPVRKVLKVWKEKAFVSA